MCRLCDLGPLGRRLTRKVLQGQLTPQQVADFLRMDVRDVEEHINEHVDPEMFQYVDDDMVMIDKLKELLEATERLFEMVFEKALEVLPLLEFSDEVDTRKLANIVNSLARLQKEYRITIREYGELIGSYANVELHTQIVQLTQKFDSLVYVVHDLCPKCREKVVNAIEATTP